MSTHSSSPPTSPLLRPVSSLFMRCAVTSCDRFAKRDGLCLGHHVHYTLLPRPQQPFRPPDAPVAPTDRRTLNPLRHVSPPPLPQRAPTSIAPAAEKMQINALVLAKQPCRKQPRDKCCAIADCDKLARIDGFCTKHNMQFASQKRKCSVDACSAYARTRGLCTRHGGGKTCAVHGCKTVSQTGGMCRAHGGGPRCKFVTCVHFTRAGGLCSLHMPKGDQPGEA